MLDELRIRGLGVIDDALLPLGPGLTAVTGETGAGKTMVVTGLLLLFGGRADAARVRSGAEQASVDGRIVGVPAAVAERVRDAGGDLDGDELALRRAVSAAGRSRAFAGGAPAPVSVLGELAERLVVVHGQSDQLRLTRRPEQLDLLDRFAGVDRDGLRADYTEMYSRWRRAATELADRTARAGELRREADLLHHGVAEIEAADPQPGEDHELRATAERLAHADGLRAAAGAAHLALTGGEDGAAQDGGDVATLVGTARRAMNQLAGADPALDKLAERLDELAVSATDIAAELRGYLDGLDADPQRLEAVQQRRSVLAALVRKYGDSTADAPADVDAVLGWAEGARERLADLDVSDDAMAALRAEAETAEAATTRLAQGLTAARAAAAERLSTAVTAELAGLAMADATITVRLTVRDALGPDGADDIDILLRPHARSPEVPVARGASGGELSRVMLALEVSVSGNAESVPTMVFDEIDAGVGGRAAVEVGRRLARLARDRQVIVVTHLAQVAAYADRQIVIDKSTNTGAAVIASDVRTVTGDDRIVELARMLAGTDSDTAREHAAELLAEADAERRRDNSPR